MMMKELQHRGPDGKGTFFDDQIALGHTRLAILDLSERGKQPMTDGDHTIVFNGEIYNYLELKEQLFYNGERFKSNTDTEVLLKTWKKLGNDSMFNGMWAYAIWDAGNKKLTLSRDKFGIKPLYYFTHGDTTVFASEVKALVKVYPKITGENPEVNIMKIANFFANIKMEHTKDTFIKNIYKLPTYYDLPRIRYHTTPENFKKYFDNALELRLRSDVEIGSCLSGGLDSSSIVCSLMKNGSIEKMHTFSACYHDTSIDERPYMHEITDGNEKIIPHEVFPSIDMLRKDMDSLIYYQDEPFETTTILAQWCVMKEAKKQGIKVLLDGQGADEVLAGYVRYKWLVSSRPQDRVRGLLWKNTKIRSEYRKLREWDVPKEMWKHIDYPNMSRDGFTNLENKLHEDVVMSLPRLLRYEDRNSMAHGIEARVPFLDFDMVDYCFSMHDSFKINEGWTKYIMREAMSGVLPEKIRWRKDKIGFWTPHKLWMDELKDEVECAVDEFKLFDARRYYDDYYKKGKDYQYTLWKIYHLSKWIPMFTGGIL